MIQNWVKEIFYTGLFLHVPEALYMAHLCRKHQMRFGLGVSLLHSFYAEELSSHQIGYVVTTLVFGFTIWVNLKKEIKALRIKSAMKVE